MRALHAVYTVWAAGAAGQPWISRRVICGSRVDRPKSEAREEGRLGGWTSEKRRDDGRATDTSRGRPLCKALQHALDRQVAPARHSPVLAFLCPENYRPVQISPLQQQRSRQFAFNIDPSSNQRLLPPPPRSIIAPATAGTVASPY